jgi:hypothetical protein
MQPENVMAVNSRLTHFRTHLCPKMGSWGRGQSQHAGREIVMPFQNLFPDIRSFDYADCYERRRAFSCIAYPMTYTVA